MVTIQMEIKTVVVVVMVVVVKSWKYASSQFSQASSKTRST